MGAQPGAARWHRAEGAGGRGRQRHAHWARPPSAPPRALACCAASGPLPRPTAPGPAVSPAAVSAWLCAPVLQRSAVVPACPALPTCLLADPSPPARTAAPCSAGGAGAHLLPPHHQGRGHKREVPKRLAGAAGPAAAAGVCQRAGGQPRQVGAGCCLLCWGRLPAACCCLLSPGLHQLQAAAAGPSAGCRWAAASPPLTPASKSSMPGCSSFAGSVVFGITTTNEQSTTVEISEGSSVARTAEAKISLEVPVAMFDGSSLSLSSSAKW